MSRFGTQIHDKVEYHLIVDPRPDGPVVGILSGLPVSESIMDRFGRRYVYAGAAPRRYSGRYDLSALARGEFILEPGLVYRMVPVPKSAMRKMFESFVARRKDAGLGHLALQSQATRTGAAASLAVIWGDARRKQGRRSLQSFATKVMTALSFVLVAHLLLAALHVG